MVANADGSLHSKQLYKPWGETRYTEGTLPTDYQYTGQRNEDSIGLYYYGARWYDPFLAQFIQPDNIIPNPYYPLAWNRYSYVLYNPLRYKDPSGNRYCDGDYDCGRKKERRPAENKNIDMKDEVTKDLYQKFIKYLTTDGWWNDYGKSKSAFSIDTFFGLWLLYERNGNLQLEDPMKVATKHQLWVNDFRKTSRAAYCTNDYCLAGAINFMAAYAGGHNKGRFPGTEDHPTLATLSNGERETISDLIEKANEIGGYSLDFTPGFEIWSGDVPWTWGNDPSNYSLISGANIGLAPNMVVAKIENGYFYLVTWNQYLNFGLTGIDGK